MIIFSSKLTKKYAVELCILHVVRKLNDGLSFIDLKMDLDWFKGNHSPAFRLYFGLFNLTIIEFNIYNMFHVDDE